MSIVTASSRVVEVRPGRERMDGYVYVIGCEPTSWAKCPLVKIGWAKYVEPRLDNLQIGSPLKLKVLLTFPGSRLMEKWLHRNFTDRHVHGEWFRMASPAQLRRIEYAVSRYMLGDDRPTASTEDAKPTEAQMAKLRAAQEYYASRSRLADARRERTQGEPDITGSDPDMT